MKASYALKAMLERPSNVLVTGVTNDEAKNMLQLFK